MSKGVELKVKEEIEKLLKAKFIRPTRYVQWLANIVHVMKKNGKLRVCVDFRDLNVATLEDMYVMPIADMLVDSTANNELLSFMDDFFGYNNILIVVEDIPKTAFRYPGSIGTFKWLVMPFGLKNACATYQREMNAISHDMLGHHMEVLLSCWRIAKDLLVPDKNAKNLLSHWQHHRRLVSPW